MYAAPILLSRAASVDLSGEPPCRGAAAVRASPTRMTPPKVRKNLRIMRQKRMHRGGCPFPPTRAQDDLPAARRCHQSGPEPPARQRLLGLLAHNAPPGSRLGPPRRNL